MNKISPKYKMLLLDEIEKAIWKEYSSYKKVKQYINQWIEEYDNFNSNFHIITKEDGKEIDLSQTLTYVDDETLLKIAVDIGVNTPDFIPIVAEVPNIFKSNYNTALEIFKKALEQSYLDPGTAISLANSALESIIKKILKDCSPAKFDHKKTLYELTQDVLKELSYFPDQNIPEEIRNIGSGLLKTSQNIETLRSNKTTAHGKLNEDYQVADSIYAFFVINTVTTVGLFLISLYEKKITNKNIYQSSNQFDASSLPF